MNAHHVRRWLTRGSLAWLALIPPATAAGQVQIDLDPFGPPRMIPDITSGGAVTLVEEQIIDVVVLGDGYLKRELADFRQDAQDWYDGYLSQSGIRPFSLSTTDAGGNPVYFSAAFRVRGWFTESVERVSTRRKSWYHTKIECNVARTRCAIAGDDDGKWTCGSNEPDDRAFRDQLFTALDQLTPPVNLARFDDDLTVLVPNSCTGGTSRIVPWMSDFYRNLVVVMLVRVDPSESVSSGMFIGASGKTKSVCCDAGDCGFADPSLVRRVRLAIGAAKRHEFGHAFANLRDEKIVDRTSAACLTNPSPASRSIYLLSNVAFSNDRDDLVWPHLAPGGLYNPNRSSPIGNLYVGGHDGLGVWHAEYKCLMNGDASNYFCDIGPPAEGTPLRDEDHFCFWCEEIVALRILARTGQLHRSGDPLDDNSRGRVWFNRWNTLLRDQYYSLFDIPTLIAQKNACYGFGSCPPASAACSGSCDASDLPACLSSCEITELVNAVYVDSATGLPGNLGTRTSPLDTVLNGVTTANGVGADIVAIRPGSYPGPLTLSDATTLIPSSCASVLLGK